jgi:hypothetical protein
MPESQTLAGRAVLTRAIGSGAFMTRAVTARSVLAGTIETRSFIARSKLGSAFGAAVVTAGTFMARAIGTRAVITAIIATGLFAALLVLAVKFWAALAVGARSVGAVVAIGEGAAQFFHCALELLYLGAEIGITGSAGAGGALCLEPVAAALTATLEIWPAEGAGLAVAA